MNKNHHSLYFLILALTASVVVLYFIAKPFLGPLILAAVFAFLFQPIYREALGGLKNNKSLAAFATTFIAVILVLLPTSLLGTQIFKESSQLYQTLLGKDGNFLSSANNLVNQVRTVLPIPADFEINFDQYLRQGLEVVIQNFGNIFSSFAKVLLNALVFLTAFYFFLKDGGKLKRYLVTLSPLDDPDDEFIASRLKAAISATVKGSLVIGLTQGALTGIGFLLFGVPNPVLWGGVAVIAAFVPGIGTAVVVMPAVIFLFLTGNTFGSLGLLIWGVVAIGLVDNFLGPKLVGRGLQLHPLAVFISVLGGLAFFGPLGFLLGPLAMSICLALIDVYTSLKTKTNNTL